MRHDVDFCYNEIMAFTKNEAKKYQSENFLRYQKFSRATKQFLAWKFLDTFDQGRLPILQNAEHRAKTYKSLERNLVAGVYDKGTPKTSPAEVDDLAGARIVCYFEDDLVSFCQRDKIAELFGTTAGDSLIDFRADGYRSFHFVVLGGEPCVFWNSLRAHDRSAFSGLRCECQARTVIQHAFGETNHELNYKYELLTGQRLDRKSLSAWRAAGKRLQRVDDAIRDLKAQWSMHPVFNESESQSREIKYDSPQLIAGVWESLRGVRFPYVMLPETIGRQFHIQEEDVLFDIDPLVASINGQDRYKRTMWEYLEKVEAENLATITYDTMVPRVCGVSSSNGEVTVTVQPAFYSDQVVSNHKFALDKKLAEGHRSMREMAFDENGALLPFSESPLSNTLGTSVVIRTRDQKWVLSHRGAVAFDPGTLGTSASGAVEWNELGLWGDRDFDSWFKGGMLRELGEELGVDTIAQGVGRSITERLVFLGLGRELGRAGKPQLFFFLDETEKDFNDLREMWLIYADSVVKKDGQLPEFKDVVGATQDQVDRLLSADASVVLESIRDIGVAKGVSEELRMNLALALDYLDGK